MRENLLVANKSHMFQISKFHSEWHPKQLHTQYYITEYWSPVEREQIFAGSSQVELSMHIWVSTRVCTVRLNVSHAGNLPWLMGWGGMNAVKQGQRVSNALRASVSQGVPATSGSYMSRTNQTIYRSIRLQVVGTLNSLELWTLPFWMLGWGVAKLYVGSET